MLKDRCHGDEHRGHALLQRMPPTLPLPITFQRMINTLFSDLIGKGVYAYQDDLIICSKDGDSHISKLEASLLKLREAGLEAKLTKCKFLK